MLHYIHQLVAKFVSGQVVYSGFLELFHYNQCPAIVKNDTDERGKSEPKQ